MDNNIALITGANGMDAKTLTHFLLSKNYTVILTYRRNSYLDEQAILNHFSPDLTKYPESKLFVQPCDITCQNSISIALKSVIERFGRLDELYLLAANSHVGESFNNKELSIQTNGTSVYYFLSYLYTHSKTTKTYFAATSELFGGSLDALNEQSLLHPRSPYAIGKNLGLNWLNFYRDLGLYCVAGFLFNHSNTYRSKDFVIRKITKAAADIAEGKYKHLTLAHLNWQRDEHWSDFGCEAMWKMLQMSTPENLVVGRGCYYSGEQYLSLAFNYFNLDWRKHVILDKAQSRPNEVTTLKADPTKAKTFLGWNPARMPFDDHIHLLCKFDHDLILGKQPTRPNVFEMYPN